MNRPKVTIAQLILVIVVVAIGLAAIRSGSPAWSGAMVSITFFAMICSLLGIALGRGARRVYWSGFATLGWSYLLLIYIPWLHENVGQYLLAPNLFEELEVFLQARESRGGGYAECAAGSTGSDSNGRRIRRRGRGCCWPHRFRPDRNFDGSAPLGVSGRVGGPLLRLRARSREHPSGVRVNAIARRRGTNNGTVSLSESQFARAWRMMRLVSHQIL